MKPPVRVRTRALDLDTKTERRAGVPQQTRRIGSDTNPQVTVMREYVEQKQIDDPFARFYTVEGGSPLTILTPPYNVGALVRLPKENNILQQCIDAMVTNVVGHGYRLAYVGPEGQEKSEAALAEKAAMEGILEYPNEDYSLQELLERVKRDKETIGFGAIECGRDATGQVTMMAHVPAHLLRKTVVDSQPTPVQVELPRNGKIEKVTINKRFRRYVQIVGAKRVYFKEIGDPRPIDPATGSVNTALALNEQATEIRIDEQYTTGEAYGLPRWLGQMPAILSSREAELTNLDYFKENAVPAMALLVSGGSVTQATLDAIEEHFTAVRGRKAMNRIVTIEVDGDETAAAPNGQLTPPRLELKPLQGERNKEGNYLDLIKANTDSVRSSFRLGPIFTGHAQDYTYASAAASFEVAESQVFGPDRNKTDDMINKDILKGYKPKFWTFRLQPPRISDPEEVIKALTAFSQMGAMSPNQIIGMANEYFDLEIPKIEEPWGDWPFDVVKQIVTNKQELIGQEKIMKPTPEPVVVDPNAAAPGGNPSNDKPAQDGVDPNGGKAKKDPMALVADSLQELHGVLTVLREAA